MPRAESFILKDSDPNLIASSTLRPQGRSYSKDFREKPGSVRIDDVVNAMKYAFVSITDDKIGTMESVRKVSPWHLEAMKIITGSEANSYQPLTTILSEHLDLTLDAHIDLRGIKRNGALLDNQGYIAHNDDTIVLSYRCTDTNKDWLIDLNATSSAWEIEEDLEQGHSGFCSGLEGFNLCCLAGVEVKPRVHTGFYNNFLESVPMIKEYIDPLLAPDQPPRKLYVVGHSLGGGLATLATCYFLLEYDWCNLPHKLMSFTAGGPRSIQQSMVDTVQPIIDELRYLDKVVVCRVVRDSDVVPILPPMLGFQHIGKMVYITEDEELLINPNVNSNFTVSAANLKDLLKSKEEEVEDSPEDSEILTEYERMVAKKPKMVRDHMPDFILKDLLKMYENEFKDGKHNKGVLKLY